MSKPMRAALYLRVSTDKQTTENQRLELEPQPLAVAGTWSPLTVTMGSAARRAGTSVQVWTAC